MRSYSDMLFLIMFDVLKQYNQNEGLEFPDHPDKLEEWQEDAFKTICVDLVERGIFQDINQTYDELKQKYYNHEA